MVLCRLLAVIRSSGGAGVPRAFETYGRAAFANAWRSPFFRSRLLEAGIAEGQVPDLERFRRIRPTTKDDLRALTAEQFQSEVVIARPADVATVWRSGGVTGRPLFYPRARADYQAIVESFSRVLDMVGVGAGDLMLNSFPLGTHPLGHMFCYAAQSLGVGCITAGSGANTPTDVQVQLLFDCRPSVFAGLASYLMHMGHVAEARGLAPRDAGVKVVLSSGEPLTPAKRARIETAWGARLLNAYGMSECSMMGAECEARDGFHLWTDMFLVEILDADREWAPVPEGELGAVVVTPLHNSHATPFLRWVSGDIASLRAACACAGPYRAFPRLRLAGRAVGFSKVKGVNVGHQELEDLLLHIGAVADFSIWVEEVDAGDRLRIEVEFAPGADEAAAAALVTERVRAAFEIRPMVEPRERGTIARRLEGADKQVRFRDVRA